MNILKRIKFHVSYWWFANDVIKNMIMQSMINLPQTFFMACETIQRVSVSNLKSFEPMKTELWAKEFEQFPLCYMGNGQVGMAYHSINVWRLFEL